MFKGDLMICINCEINKSINVAENVANNLAYVVICQKLIC